MEIASDPNEILYIRSFSAQDLANAVTPTARLICENSASPDFIPNNPIEPTTASRGGQYYLLRVNSANNVVNNPGMHNCSWKR